MYYVKLCNKKSLDILNALNLVSTTKALIQTRRDEGWTAFIENVKSFCERYEIDIPDLSSQYIVGRGRSLPQRANVTLEHHYRIDIFIAAIDSQLHELDSRFCEQTMELLFLNAALDPKDAYTKFKIDDICRLVEKYYLEDFIEHERVLLRFQLQHYELDVPQHPKLRNLPSIVELYQGLMETNKTEVYYLIDRLICIVLTLPVSTATIERAFSVMKIVKNELRNKMEDEFLADCMVVYIERDIAENFDSDSIIDDFYSLKNRQAQL